MQDTVLLQKLRTTFGFTCQRFAEKIGVSVEEIERWETEGIEDENLPKFLDGLNLPSINLEDDLLRSAKAQAVHSKELLRQAVLVGDDKEIAMYTKLAAADLKYLIDARNGLEKASPNSVAKESDVQTAASPLPDPEGTGRVLSLLE